MERTGSGAPPLESQVQHADATAHREWAYLHPDLLCQVLSDDPDASLRRAGRAVCRDWRGTVDSRLITQLCCDIDHLPRIRSLPGLRHVIVEGVYDKLCGRQRMQQRLWAHARLAGSSANPVTSRSPRVTAFPGPRGDLSPLAALPRVQAVTLRCLPMLTRSFQKQAVHLTHLTSLTLHQPQYVDIVPFKGLREALSVLEQLKALALINLQECVVEPVLTPAKRQRSTPAAAAEEEEEEEAAAGAVTSAVAEHTTAGAGSSEPVEAAAAAAAGSSSSSSAAEEGCDQRPCSTSTGSSSSSSMTRSGSASLSSGRAAGLGSSLSSSSAAAVIQEAAGAGPSSSSSSSSSSSNSSSNGVSPPCHTLPCPWLGNLGSLTIRVTDLPDLRPALASLTSCTHLDLSHCSIDGELPASLGQLTQLKVLDLSYSCSRRLPKSCWSHLTALTRLSLSGDNLSGASHVPLKQLPSLQHVELRDQRLRTKALLGCAALQVLDMRGCDMRKPAVDTLGTVLRKQPTLQKVLYGPRCGLKMASLVERHSGVTWVFDPDWDQPYGGNLGDQWSEDEEGLDASSSGSSDSEGEGSDDDSDSSSSSSSSSRGVPRDVVSNSSSDFGSWDDFSSHHSSEDEEYEEDGGSLTWDELEAMAFGAGAEDDAGSLTWDELEAMAFGPGSQAGSEISDSSSEISELSSSETQILSSSEIHELSSESSEDEPVVYAPPRAVAGLGMGRHRDYRTLGHMEMAARRRRRQERRALGLESSSSDEDDSSPLDEEHAPQEQQGQEEEEQQQQGGRGCVVS